MPPHPQIMAPMSGNQDRKNPVSKLTIKETSNFQNPPTPTITSDQVANLVMAIYVYVDEG